jgi:HSP20 family protein
MDDMFHNFFGDWENSLVRRRNWPALDIAEDENNITVNLEVPGCKAEDIDISVHGNTLTVTGEKKEKEEKKEKGYYHMERSYGSFRRDVNLPSDVHTNNINAVCSDGVLTIKLPKAEQAKAVKVKVKTQ